MTPEQIARGPAMDLLELVDSTHLLELADRLDAACSREGKPSGAHMIDAQRSIAKILRDSDDEAARDIADVAELAAHCIENEALLFECLVTEAKAAAAALRAIGRAG